MNDLSRVVCFTHNKVGEEYIFKTQTLFQGGKGFFVKQERMAINNVKIVDSGFFLSAIEEALTYRVEWIGFINGETNVKVCTAKKTPCIGRKNTITLLNNITEDIVQETIRVNPKRVEIYGTRYIVTGEDDTVYYVIVK